MKIVLYSLEIHPVRIILFTNSFSIKGNVTVIKIVSAVVLSQLVRKLQTRRSTLAYVF